jgi:hypothetical protein
MKKIVKITENDLTNMVKRILNEQSPLTTKPETTGVTTKQDVTTINIPITIDCGRNVIKQSSLPKLTSKDSNIELSTVLINKYCKK